MLPNKFKIHLRNNAANNTTADFRVVGQGYKFGTDGALQYGTVETLLSHSGAINAGATQSGSEITNSNGWIGMKCKVEMGGAVSGGPAGSFEVYQEHEAGDSGGSTPYPSDAAGFVITEDAILVGTLQANGNSVRATNFDLT